MNKESYIKWNPIANISSNIYFKELRDNRDGFVLTLKTDADQLVQITADWVLLYRALDERYLLSRWRMLEGQLPWPFFRVEPSELVRAFRAEAGLVPDESCIHIFIVTYDICVDLLCGKLPDVKII